MNKYTEINEQIAKNLIIYEQSFIIIFLISFMNLFNQPDALGHWKQHILDFLADWHYFHYY